ncbi:hypothetical protein FVEG_16058 [Fusarium verticillioides 7600]|uniref:Uncharacterized protein n=1 Tax=Gibberella moniliformis (strain M3125 / FGSC 7600) TaxID=334819 RepID=W7M7N1_GIBM7|nr:hypothetical protein FVEG_16058 [Fusarium verticillioides 7600]XP_018753202.1 hypothetical protein FVEG_16058 [Fusarium verticillioides 7600]EWG47010.1 hypothetical protein FVEG_16058 [Fusarium verticillioides 7600]EWG47011.1 hypothetical protein FVEG_16058 [Fusarium verticillioides 7600]
MSKDWHRLLLKGWLMCQVNQLHSATKTAPRQTRCHRHTSKAKALLPSDVQVLSLASPRSAQTSKGWLPFAVWACLYVSPEVPDTSTCDTNLGPGVDSVTSEGSL